MEMLDGRDADGEFTEMLLVNLSLPELNVAVQFESPAFGHFASAQNSPPPLAQSRA